MSVINYLSLISYFKYLKNLPKVLNQSRVSEPIIRYTEIEITQYCNYSNGPKKPFDSPHNFMNPYLIFSGNI